MTSKVKVNMTICAKTHFIEVAQRDDGDFDIRAETDCDNVREFVDMLGTLTVVDLTDKMNSKIWECFKRARMSANCLVPAALVDAGWMELGMLSKSRALSCGSKSIEYIKEP